MDKPDVRAATYKSRMYQTGAVLHESTHRWPPSSQPCRHLSTHDERMGALISVVGEVGFTPRGDCFEALARSVVGQQLSAAAARTIWMRLESFLGKVSTTSVAEASVVELRSLGVSRPKIAYLQNLATRVLDGSLDFTGLDSMPDDAVVRALVEVPGIGPWTAEMFLVFSLGRLDVLSTSDAGLLRAARWLYADEDMGSSDLGLMGLKWAPFRSIASLYLWAAIDRGLISEPATRLRGCV